jgi:hypothetical protein
MDWFKKHSELIGAIIAVFGGFIWIHGEIKDVRKELSAEIYDLKKDMTIIKTVLMMKDILPRELAATDSSKTE